MIALHRLGEPAPRRVRREGARTPPRTAGCHPPAREALPGRRPGGGPLEQGVDECAPSPRRQRGERKRRGVQLATAPARTRASSSGVRYRRRGAGRRVAQSTRWSTKSRRPSSAQCRSSNTSTSGRCVCNPSRNPRQAVNASSWLSARRHRRAPASGRRWASDPFDVVCRRPSARRRRGVSAAASSSVVGLEDAGVRFHHLAQRPEADALAVGAVSDPDASRRARGPARPPGRARRRAGSCRCPAPRRGSRAVRAPARARARRASRSVSSSRRRPTSGVRTAAAMSRRGVPAPRSPPTRLIRSDLPFACERAPPRGSRSRRGSRAMSSHRRGCRSPARSTGAAQRC